MNEHVNIDTVELDTKSVIDSLNKRLRFFGAPALAEQTDLIQRSKQFTLFNSWLQEASDAVINELVNEYGLIIVILGVTGINLDHVILLQEKKEPDYTGFIRYIDNTLLRSTHHKAKHIRKISKDLLNDDFMDLKTPEVRSQIISYILERYINMKGTYDDAIRDLLLLVSE